MIERNTEGIHSIVKRSLGRAPNASMSYLSLELRFAQLMHSAVMDPLIFANAIQNLYGGLASLKGFREAVCQLLHLRPNSDVCGLTQRQLANLLYRDQLSLKHSFAGQIKLALENLLTHKENVETSSYKKLKADALSVAIVDFLVDVL